MDCRRFDAILHELDRRGTEGAASREEALAHAEHCGRCASMLTEAEALDFSLQSIAQQSVAEQAPPRVEATLLEQFRRERRERGRRVSEWRLATIGVAAIILFSLGLTFLHRPASLDSQMHSEEPVTTHTQSGAQPLSPLPWTTRAAREVPPKAAIEPPGGQAAEGELSTAFVPLPYADDPAGEDGSVVVRVILPESALASLDLLDAGDGSKVGITADLLVGVDGTPQAIRLVSPAGTRETY